MSVKYKYVQYVFVNVLLNKGIQFSQRSFIKFLAHFLIVAAKWMCLV